MLVDDDDISVDIVFLKIQVYELTNKFKKFYNYHHILRFEYLIFLKLNFKIIIFTYLINKL